MLLTSPTLFLYLDRHNIYIYILHTIYCTSKDADSVIQHVLTKYLLFNSTSFISHLQLSMSSPVRPTSIWEDHLIPTGLTQMEADR